MTADEKRKLIRVIPMPDGMQRMESGPIQFGDDWPGFFLRGDHAMEMVPLYRLLKLVCDQPELLNRPSVHMQILSAAWWLNAMSQCLMVDDGASVSAPEYPTRTADDDLDEPLGAPACQLGEECESCQ